MVSYFSVCPFSTNIMMKFKACYLSAPLSAWFVSMHFLSFCFFWIYEFSCWRVITLSVGIKSSWPLQPQLPLNSSVTYFLSLICDYLWKCFCSWAQVAPLMILYRVNNKPASLILLLYYKCIKYSYWSLSLCSSSGAHNFNLLDFDHIERITFWTFF